MPKEATMHYWLLETHGAEYPDCEGALLSINDVDLHRYAAYALLFDHKTFAHDDLTSMTFADCSVSFAQSINWELLAERNPALHERLTAWQDSDVEVEKLTAEEAVLLTEAIGENELRGSMELVITKQFFWWELREKHSADTYETHGLMWERDLKEVLPP